MVNRKISFLSFIAVLFATIIACTQGASKSIMINKNEITKRMVEMAGGMWNNAFIIQFSNIIYEEDSKKIKMPIFHGTSGDVLYKDFREYCLINKYLEPRVKESGFVIKCKNGEVKKTFHEFLKFYKSNILKDVNIESRSNFNSEEDVWTIFFKFKVDGIPCVMTILIDASKDGGNRAKIKYL